MIQQADQLQTFAERIAAAPWIALDTEADSLHAYPEKLCLLQISIPGADELVDPLAGIDLAPLLRALDNHEILIHGADYDLRLLYRTYGFKPKAIFETVWAARLVGLQQFGLTSLLEQLLGLTLEKGSQKADWARRPLTPRMEEYARNDSRHLRALADILRAKLVEAGRLDWHTECCARMIDDAAHVVPEDPDDVWRLAGANKLGRRGLAVLRELWHWREQEAVAANRPPFFVLQHDTLLGISDAVDQQIPFEPLLPRRLSPHRRAGVNVAVEKAIQLPLSTLPEPRRQYGRRLTDAEKKRFEHIRVIRDAKAKELGIDPTLIASKSVMGALALDWAGHSPELMRWQHGLLQQAAP